jgi:hypothetical protein
VLSKTRTVTAPPFAGTGARWCAIIDDMMTEAQQRAWLAQWERARGALDGVHTRELESLTAEDALRASDALLSLADPHTLSVDRRTTSGLVIQQRLFHAPRH